jgi:hypothetical protein
MHWLHLVIPVALSSALVFGGSADFRLERKSVPGGAELVTIFGPLASRSGKNGSDPVRQVPLVSILRDTLGDNDPANDRLRSIWVLTSARPNVLQRVTAGLPFFYYRPNLGRNADHQPAPVLDMANTRSAVWTRIAGQIAQVLALDPEGALIRSSTRTYRTNAADHRRTKLLEGLSVLSRAEDVTGDHISDKEMQAMQARLALAGQILGGLVDDDHLSKAYYKQRGRTEETRGHNWELLRQRAEANGLYFEPFGLDGSSTHALLLIDPKDLANTTHPYDRRFLDIQNPYVDVRLKLWKGITVPAYFDAEGRKVSTPVQGGTTRNLIPLALYSLEYPKVPLLLADFRSPRGTKRREMFRRATDDTVVGVFGISRFGNWPYMAGSMIYSFVRSRHGDPNNRPARLAAYAQTRRWLSLDAELDPRLRDELLRRVETMGVNPLDESVFREQNVAERQYAALEKYVAAPNGLAARLERDRNEERTEMVHNWGARFGLKTVHLLSLGAYQHREEHGQGLLEALDSKRRSESGIKAAVVRGVDAGGQ